MFKGQTTQDQIKEPDTSMQSYLNYTIEKAPKTNTRTICTGKRLFRNSFGIVL